MADDDARPPPPINPESPLPPKTPIHPVYTVTDITRKVRVLDGTKVSYASWVSLFTLHARGYKVLDHIDGTPPPAPTDPTFAAWLEIDAHVLQWIYGTLSDEYLPRVLDTENNSTAQQAWTVSKEFSSTTRVPAPLASRPSSSISLSKICLHLTPTASVSASSQAN
ncbi:hypothetical protein vseg_006477 [Gypsophila vaccaria]